MIRRRTRDRKVESSNPGRSGGRIFLSSVNFLCSLIRCPFQPRSTAVARKRHRSFYQKCRWQVTPKRAYTLGPAKSEYADYSAVQAWCGNLPSNELTRHMSGNSRPQSSQLAEPLWADPGLKSGISVRERISTLKKISAGGEQIVEHSSKVPASEEKPPPPEPVGIK